MKVVNLPQRGGCACQAVRYTLTRAPLLVYACHCRDCQKQTGSAFTLTVVVRSADLAISGPTELQQKLMRSGRALEHTCCAQCRVRVLSRATTAPDYTSLRAGSLDETGWVVPIAQAFVESAIPWAIIPNVRSIAEFDYYALGEEWRATAPHFTAP